MFDIKLKCKSCKHMFTADNKWAKRIDPGGVYDTEVMIHSLVKKILPKLKCSKCGKKGPEIAVALSNSGGEK